jgi:hypothetical protein
MRSLYLYLVNIGVIVLPSETEFLSVENSVSFLSQLEKTRFTWVLLSFSSLVAVSGA